ncbi:MAG TPA: PRC-barrel domain-containing protein, partial [Thermoclostridium sp.]|nr:PRC-barrel domain-containing protein [Thermoclostridium sp.]
MKTTQQIVGLPVISISDGNEIGMVKNVIINAAKGTVDFFVIDSGVRSLAGGVIPAGRVLGIGEYALTIQEPDDISDIVKIPAAIELIQKNITVKGTRVLTKKGSLLGEAGDIYINEDDASYAITGVEFIPGKPDMKSGIIPRSS